jgi:hypothetical protein
MTCGKEFAKSESQVAFCMFNDFRDGRENQMSLKHKSKVHMDAWEPKAMKACTIVGHPSSIIPFASCFALKTHLHDNGGRQFGKNTILG